jgi:hypothetical protein
MAGSFTKSSTSYRGKSLKPGGGGRFARLVDEFKSKGKSAGSAKAIAASIGQKKYGAKKMSNWAAAGRK